MAQTLFRPIVALLLILVAGCGIDLDDVDAGGGRSAGSIRGAVGSTAAFTLTQFYDPGCSYNYPTYSPMMSNGRELQDLYLCLERFGRWTLVRNTSQNKVWYFTSPAYTTYWTRADDGLVPLKVQLFRAAMRRHFAAQGLIPRRTLEPGTHAIVEGMPQIGMRQEPYDTTVWQLTSLSVNTVRKKAPNAVPLVFGRGSPTRKALLTCGVSGYQAVERLTAEPSGSEIATALGLRGDYSRCATALDRAAERSPDPSVTLTSGELRRPTLRQGWLQRAERWFSPLFRVARYGPRG